MLRCLIMDREEADRILACLVSAQKKLDAAVIDAAVIEVERLDRTEEADSLRQTLAHAIGTVAADAIAPIIALYPDLDPYSTDG